MRIADIPLGMRLKLQAGWNQTHADWNRFLQLEPNGCFVGELNGRAVGTATTSLFGNVAWIGMMLVEYSSRGQGVGKALMHEALDYLGERGVVSCRLDATPLGRPLYEKLGFVPQLQINRFAGEVTTSQPSAGGDALGDNDWEAVVALDKEVVGYDRHRFLAKLREDSPTAIVSRVGDRVHSYGFARDGALATYLGPCIAAQPEQGRCVLSCLLHRFRGARVFVDVPASHDEAQAIVASAGLTPARQLTRMCRGEPQMERVDCLWASSGPEKG